MNLERYLKVQILSDLEKKMVFLGGPRQVGKTHLAVHLPSGGAGYLSWDAESDRSRILDQKFPKSPLWVFDEIHKFKRWRNYLKGIFDTKAHLQKILVTGSARLDLYRHGGDSLQGRYHYLRLHPLSFAEVRGSTSKDLVDLFALNGFPEIYFGGSRKEANRWTLEYRKRLVRDEVSSLEKIEDLGTMEILARLLPEKVGSPLSLNSLREDLGVAHATVRKWLDVFERLYLVFRIPPFGFKFPRAVKKEQKHYHFDWNAIREDGPRFENMVACHLKKWVDYREDCFGEELELKYFRDTDGREIDFIVTEGQSPKFAIECKISDEQVSQPLRLFKSKFPKTEIWQISLRGKKDYLTAEGIRVAPAIELLKNLI